jgi:hypothetical protein
MTKALAKKIGYNDSVNPHRYDLYRTDRTVTATLKDGSAKVIYEKGQFTNLVL